MSSIDRRTFITASAAAAATGVTVGGVRAESGVRTFAPPRTVISIASGNGLQAVTRATEMVGAGADCVDGVVQGVSIVEDDPNDMSVGYGGLPNERGVVELDSSVMHGPTHKAGAVASLQNIRNPSQVALTVLRRTDHVMIVGEGALEFARAHGFKEQDMLTDKAREAWVRWKRNLNPNDDWLDDSQEVAPPADRTRAEGPIPHTWGTIHCSAVDTNGDISAVTTTSGLSYKIPGRVGDSPIIGAGMFVDNEVGSGGATGRGESAIQSCAAFQIVQRMAAGDEPSEACLNVLRWVAAHSRRPELLNDAGNPNFGLTLYALRKDGTHGAATMRRGASYAVHDGTGAARKERCAVLYK